jgi:hypothetical protein
MQAVHRPQAGVDDAVGLEVGDQHPVAFADRSKRHVEGVNAFSRGTRGGHDPGGVGKRHAQHGRAAGPECRNHLIQVADDLFEVDAWSQDVVEAPNDAHQVGFQVERWLELLVTDLAHLAPPDSEVGVEQVRLLAGEPDRQPVGESAVVDAVGHGVLEPFGGAVADSHISAESGIAPVAIHAGEGTPDGLTGSQAGQEGVRS